MTIRGTQFELAECIITMSVRLVPYMKSTTTPRASGSQSSSTISPFSSAHLAIFASKNSDLRSLSTARYHVSWTWQWARPSELAGGRCRTQGWHRCPFLPRTAASLRPRSFAQLQTFLFWNQSPRASTSDTGASLQIYRLDIRILPTIRFGCSRQEIWASSNINPQSSATCSAQQKVQFGSTWFQTVVTLYKL